MDTDVLRVPLRDGGARRALGDPSWRAVFEQVVRSDDEWSVRHE
jgi:hypothetical protein